MMEIIKQAIPDVLLIKPQVHGDERGYFMESYRQDRLAEYLGYQPQFVQDNESRSCKGVLRGLHYQLAPRAQSKLVRVIEGEVLDVAVDIRHGSPWYGQHIAVHLSAQNKQQLFIPRGFAHGFVVLSEHALFSYKVDNYYSPQHDRGLAYNDPELAIDWILPEKQLLLSGKDQQQPAFAQLEHDFYYTNPNPDIARLPT